MSAERPIQNLTFPLSVSERELKTASQMLDRVDVLTKFENQNGRLERFSDMIASGAYPVIYSNHNQHGNIAGFREVWRGMHTRPDNFYVVVAHSLTTGGTQDEKIVRNARALKELFRNENVYMLEVTRPKDFDDYREDEATDEKIAELQALNRRNINTIVRSTKKSEGIFIFPSGTTTEADKDKDGKRLGLQKVQTDILPLILTAAHRFSREVALLPVGHVDTNRIVEPRTTRGHPLAYAGVALSILHLPSPKLAKVIVGEPYSLESMLKDKVNIDDPEVINDYAMRKVAELLPENARGYYAK